jgi:hypothetical protein
MSGIQRVGDLEIEQDLAAQERMWRVERLGWTLFALLILAALLGIFGSGLLSAATVEQGVLRVNYNRFERFETPTAFEIHVVAEAGAAAVAVWLPHDYLQHVEVTNISPEPQEVRTGANRLTYIFALQDAADAGRITFYLTPLRVGPLAAQVGVDAAPPVQFTQFVYP